MRGEKRGTLPIRLGGFEQQSVIRERPRDPVGGVEKKDKILFEERGRSAHASGFPSSAGNKLGGSSRTGRIR